MLEECSDFVCETLQALVDQIPEDAVASPQLLYSGHIGKLSMRPIKLLQERNMRRGFLHLAIVPITLP